MKIDVIGVLIRVAERPPIWEKPAYSVYCSCLVYVCAFNFGFEEGMWNLIVLVSIYCFSVYFGIPQNPF